MTRYVGIEQTLVSSEQKCAKMSPVACGNYPECQSHSGVLLRVEIDVDTVGTECVERDRTFIRVVQDRSERAA